MAYLAQRVIRRVPAQISAGTCSLTPVPTTAAVIGAPMGAIVPHALCAPRPSSASAHATARTATKWRRRAHPT
jgi:hypothetical protein